MAFDKTGTLTLGAPRLTTVTLAEGAKESQVLRLAAAVESRSEHPIARAIVQAAAERGLSPEAPGQVTAIPGKGLWADVAGSRVVLGNRAMLRDLGLDPGGLRDGAEAIAQGRRHPGLRGAG